MSLESRTFGLLVKYSTEANQCGSAFWKGKKLFKSDKISIRQRLSVIMRREENEAVQLTGNNMECDITSVDCALAIIRVQCSVI